MQAFHLNGRMYPANGDYGRESELYSSKEQFRILNLNKISGQRCRGAVHENIKHLLPLIIDSAGAYSPMSITYLLCKHSHVVKVFSHLLVGVIGTSHGGGCGKNEKDFRKEDFGGKRKVKHF